MLGLTKEEELIAEKQCEELITTLKGFDKKPDATERAIYKCAFRDQQKVINFLKSLLVAEGINEDFIDSAIKGIRDV